MRLPRWLRWRSNDELDEEILAHLELEIEENLTRGMSPEEARRAARRKFGNVGLAKERARDGDPVVWMEHLVREARHAFRRLSRSPGFAGTAVLTLALGIGSTVSILSIAEPLITRSLRVHAPEELVLTAYIQPDPSLWSDEAFRFRIEGPQQDCVDDAENCCVGTDRQSENQDDGYRRARLHREVLS